MISTKEEAKAIVSSAFRNNPTLESIHSENKISQLEMKEMMKFAVDQVNFMLWAKRNHKKIYFKLIKLQNMCYTLDWDDPKDPQELFNRWIKLAKEYENKL